MHLKSSAAAAASSLSTGSPLSRSRICLLLVTVFVLIVLVLLFRISFHFHSSQFSKPSSSFASSRHRGNPKHRELKKPVIIIDRSGTSSNKNNQQRKNAVSDLDSGVHQLGRDELKFLRMKELIDAARQQADAEKEEERLLQQELQQQQAEQNEHLNPQKQQPQQKQKLDDDKDDDQSGFPTQAATAPPRESGLVTVRKLQVPFLTFDHHHDHHQLPEIVVTKNSQTGVDKGGDSSRDGVEQLQYLLPPTESGGGVNQQQQQLGTRIVSVTDISLILLKDDASGLTGSFVRRVRDFFPAHLVRLWKERLIHMWSKDPIFHRRKRHSDPGGKDDDGNNSSSIDDIDEQEFENRLLLLAEQNASSTAAAAAASANAGGTVNQQHDALFRIKQKLKDIGVALGAADEATGADFVYATNNNGIAFGVKQMNRKNVEQRRDFAISRITQMPEMFGYSKYELRRTTLLHLQMKEYFNTVEMRQSVCRILDSDCPSGFVHKAYMGDFFVSLFEHDDFLTAHNDMSLGEITVVAHLLVDKRAMQRHLAGLRQNAASLLDGGNGGGENQKKKMQKQKRGAGVAVDENDKTQKTKKRMSPLLFEQQEEDDFFGLDDPEPEQEQRHLEERGGPEATERRLHSTVFNANVSGAVQFYCFDKKGWCLDLPVSKNELVVFTSKISAPHRVTLMKREDHRFLRFGVTTWFGMEKSQMMLRY